METAREQLRPGQGFFVVMAVLAAVVALIGFASTFLVPIARGSFAGSPAIFAHAAATFGWIALFVLQPSLIRAGAYDIHVRTGMLGALLAIAVAITGVQVGVFATERDLAAGVGPTAISTILGVVTGMTVFLALVAAGIAFRKNPDTHKRLMLLATIVVLWPAWFRFRHYFPDVPRPDIWFALVAADSLIVIAALRDKLALGCVHPVWLFVGSLVIIEHTFEALMFDTPAWRAVAHAVFDVLR